VQGLPFVRSNTWAGEKRGGKKKTVRVKICKSEAPSVQASVMELRPDMDLGFTLGEQRSTKSAERG